MKNKKTNIFLLKSEDGDTIITADTLNEAKDYKKFIKNNFNVGDKKILIRQKITNQPDERIVKKANKVAFVIINKDGEKFAKFDSLNEAKFFLNRLKKLFGEPNNKLIVKEFALNKKPKPSRNKFRDFSI